MAFSRPDQLARREIVIDSSQAQASDPDFEKRLARIANNYEQLNDVLQELESRMAADDRLQAIDDGNFDFQAEFGIRRKRKWRSTTNRKKSPRGINKPR